MWRTTSRRSWVVGNIYWLWVRLPVAHRACPTQLHAILNRPSVPNTFVPIHDVHPIIHRFHAVHIIRSIYVRVNKVSKQQKNKWPKRLNKRVNNLCWCYACVTLLRIQKIVIYVTSVSTVHYGTYICTCSTCCICVHAYSSTLWYITVTSTYRTVHSLGYKWRHCINIQLSLFTLVPTWRGS